MLFNFLGTLQQVLRKIWEIKFSNPFLFIILTLTRICGDLHEGLILYSVSFETYDSESPQR